MSDSRRHSIVFIASLALSMSPLHCLFGQGEKTSGKNAVRSSTPIKASDEKKLETATFGGGCFWCVEAVYQRVDGVKSIVSGYAGGHVPNPTYEQVCTKLTGHAEVCQITFDPSVVSFDEMLLIFFKTHDPTTPNQQGADVGPQYRSVIFYNDDTQREAAEKMKAKLLEEKVFRKISTEISPLPEFYPAEAYHQNYFKLHPEQAYCRNVIVDKVAKFEKQFKENSKLQKEKAAKKK
ncbi:MAG TPA: peptide-methionine (S)-S-oxide reductase MsrA [Pirellula sp.]|nr:peptide-methionine (S)-S-oxide reductase MsrA [Pirellula sp.]